MTVDYTRYPDTMKVPASMLPISKVVNGIGPNGYGIDTASLGEFRSDVTAMNTLIADPAPISAGSG